ncbi:MAG TPA: hypothetical protein VI078_16075 [bacterium]
MRKTVVLLCLAVLLGTAAAAVAADTLHFVIMSSEDPKKEGPKYTALAEYLKTGMPQEGVHSDGERRFLPHLRAFREGAHRGEVLLVQLLGGARAGGVG